jgi:hypothetical protein
MHPPPRILWLRLQKVRRKLGLGRLPAVASWTDGLQAPPAVDEARPPAASL